MSNWKNTYGGKDAHSGQDAHCRRDAPSGWRAALRAVDVMEYDLDGIEEVTAQLIQHYLSCLTEDTARKLMRDVIKLPEDMVEEEQPYAIRELPERSAVIEGKQLAAMIDLAVGNFVDIIEERLLTTRSEEEARILSQIIDGASEFNGALIVQNASVQFYDFLWDCYRVLGC